MFKNFNKNKQKQDKGRIIGYSQRTPEFLDYSNNEFENTVDNVTEFMPECVAKHHDDLIYRLIQ